MTTSGANYSAPLCSSAEFSCEAFVDFVPETDFSPATTHGRSLSSMILTEEEEEEEEEGEQGGEEQTVLFDAEAEEEEGEDRWRKTASKPSVDDVESPDYYYWSDVESQKTKETRRMHESRLFHVSNRLPGDYELRISDACRQLNILNNPLLWTYEEVRSWCDWALGLYQVHPTRRRTLLNDINHNGTSFSRLQPNDFDRLFHSAGVYVFAELELWKNATEISSTRLLLSTEFLSINQTATGVTSTTTNSPNDSLWSADDHRVHRVSSNFESFDAHAVNQSSSVAANNHSSSSSSNVTPASTNSTESNTADDCHSWWNIPTVVMHFKLDEKDPIAEDPFRDQEEDGAASAAAALVEDCGGQAGRHHRRAKETVANRASQSGHSDDNEAIRAGGHRIPSPDDDDWQTYSKHGHHLWQFLQELLQRPLIYENCIRWIDRRQGIFKIGDSVTVARLWGQRKNRPAMNYDKLSRSIRQYYKKGIIRKTSHSKRLVYQFCPRYSI